MNPSIFPTSQPHHITVAAYMLNEREGGVRHEYVDGTVSAMAGAKPPHIDVTRNVGLLFGTQILRKGCHFATSDQLVKTGDGAYFYPDAYALCGERSYSDDPVPALLNFAVIVEVLSDSTRSYDRGEKFARYRSTPTLREYLVIDPERVYVELHTRRMGAARDHRPERDHYTASDPRRAAARRNLPERVLVSGFHR